MSERAPVKRPLTQITAMQMAAMAGQTECVALLLKAKARCTSKSLSAGVRLT